MRDNEKWVPHNPNKTNWQPHNPNEWQPRNPNSWQPRNPNMQSQDNVQSTRQEYRRKAKRKHWYSDKRFYTLFSILIIMGVIGGGYYEYNRMHSIVDNAQMSKGFDNHNAQELYRQGKPFTIMLLGTDTGELGRTDRGRTDTILLATVNKKKKTILLTSISRDTMVYVSGYTSAGPQKINAAYELGNVKATQKTVEKYLNVPINGYALVNMKGLIQSVNRVNGITVKSPLTFQFSPETAHEHGKHEYKFTKGSSTFKYSNDHGETWQTKQKMNGQDALAFSRMRYMDPMGDYGRQLRQRLVIAAILNKAKSIKNIVTTNFLETLSSSVKTNLSFDDILTIAETYKVSTRHIKGNYLTGHDLTGEDGTIYQTSTQKDKQAVTNKIRKLLGLPYAKTGPKYAGKSSTKDIDDDSTSDNNDTSSNDSNSSAADNFVNQYNSDNSNDNPGNLPTLDDTDTSSE